MILQGLPSVEFYLSVAVRKKGGTFLKSEIEKRGILHLGC